MSFERTLERIPLLLLTLTGCNPQLQEQLPLSTPRVIVVTATPTEIPAQVAAPATLTPEPTALPTATSEPVSVNPAECQPDDVKQESEVFVAESLGVLRRKLPVKESDHDGAVAQNTRLQTQCLRNTWYRVADGKGGFWILSDYVSNKPIVAPTPVAVQRVEPKQPQPEPKAEQKILLNEGLNRPLARGFMERVNIARRSTGIAELKVDSRLQSAAEKYAQRIYTNTSNVGTCSGQAVEVNCHMVDGAPWDRAKREGYPSTSVWEVFMGLQSDRIRQIRRNPTEEEIIATLLDPKTYTDFGLFNSPPHRETLLDRANTLIGVGCYLGPDHYASRQSGKTEYSGICIGELSR
ncbi:hypothetical protein HYU96_00225 [Candidatus Daviesbacteria bacterium]|nr:hypothetical protein [Candidatus Daviesbacteria bacterium]